MTNSHETSIGIPLLEKKYRRLLFYSRFFLLYQLAYYGKDGIAYNALKDTIKLGIPAGSLSPNLLWLKQQGYIIDKASGSDESIYYITKEGEIAFNELKKWLEIIMDIGR